MKEDLENLDHALCTYLDTKRSQFARLFFTSNEELIELLGQLQGEDFLKNFIGKLFEGVGGLLFANDEDGNPPGPHLEGAKISGVLGRAGECVRLLEPVAISPHPEAWLKEFEHAMKRALYVLMASAVADRYAGTSGDAATDLLGQISRWPGQNIIATLQIAHSNDMARVFRKSR